MGDLEVLPSLVARFDQGGSSLDVAVDSLTAGKLVVSKLGYLVEGVACGDLGNFLGNFGILGRY